jgi:hypothetical protein
LSFRYNSLGHDLFSGEKYSKPSPERALYSPRLFAMNALFVGTKNNIKIPKKGIFLFIDDEVPNIPLAQTFDPRHHSLDPLRNITKHQARELAEVLYTLAPEGNTTLAVRNGRRDLAPALFEADRFDRIKSDNEEVEAMVKDILFLPVLNEVLCGKKDIFALKRHTVVLARLNRAEIGDFAARVLGFILINMFKGQIVVPDFGFYGRDIHIGLVRENRLIAGVRYLDELPLQLRRAVLTIPSPEAHGALHEDAELLARYAGLVPHTNGYNAFVDDAMG